MYLFTFTILDFKSSFTILDDDSCFINLIIQSLGIINGRISKKKIGNKGFGYDPIFIPENKRLTFGQMSQKLKFKNDHRAQAFKKIKKFL